ncbi:folliculin-interacting protein 2-like isoform X2 [Mizuhopecten yessoensis]|uniref:folliculin-interacting protein 2-like isoform X2 n=1 Tax=Mizuhopecten yessoensis TaxID=6573 RepID=UPI000B45CC54|nr:folliculin-interacting protein 2-like isoform X2 [Mizuhopecten yessoensis]
MFANVYFTFWLLYFHMQVRLYYQSPQQGSTDVYHNHACFDCQKMWKTPKFDPDQIRLVIYADNERDRTLLFDSKAVKRNVEPRQKCCHGLRRFVSPKTKLCVPSEQVCGGRQSSKFLFTKPGSDVQSLEEIMFGSVGMAYTGSSLKVHLTKSPPQLMLTKVFVPEAPKRESSGSELDSDSLSLQSHSDPSEPKPISCADRNGGYLAESVPMDVPLPSHSKRASFDIIDEDSGLASLTSSGSFHTPFPSPGSNASSYSSSYNSLHRRWMRVQYTSLESGLKKRNSQDNLVAHESFSSCTTSSTTNKKQSKIALGILFGLEEDKDCSGVNRCFENFFFSHITLFEGHLDKLKAGVSHAYYNRKQFVHIVMEALENFRRDVQDLYTTPRLSEPVWLNMMSHSSYRYVMCEKFMKQFMFLVSKYDNKSTNFFMSTLVTAVLTHHLAWVPTVTPAGGTSIRTYLHNHTPNWVDTFAKTHPYNPLWAQLGDLYGAIGFPLKLARTVVVGKKADLVKKILYILTYFIRCSDVHENDELGSLKSCLDDLTFEMESERQDITPILEKQPDFFLPVREENSGSRIRQGETNFGKEREEAALSSPRIREGNHDKSCRQRSECSKDGEKKKSGSTSSCDREKHQNPCDSGKVKLLCSPKGCVRQISVETELRRISKEYEDIIPKTIKSVQKNDLHLRLSDDSSLTDEGYHSILQPDHGYSSLQRPCSLSVSQIVETVPVENIKNVSRSAEILSSDFIEIPTPNPVKPQALSPSSSCSVSRLSQKLLEEEESSSRKDVTEMPTAKVSDIRTRYLEEGSNSMFDEYFTDPSIETKTIDNLDAKDRIISFPLVKSESIRSSTDSIIRELAGCANSPTAELQGTHENRLGSFGGGIRPRISSFSRQYSTDRNHISGRPNSLAPGRCRSVTPTELSRRRHLSSTSSYDVDLSDPTSGCKELDMPNFSGELSSSSIKVFDRNFGRSLMAGYSDHYLSDFVLHGTSENSFHEKLRSDLEVAVQHSVLDEPIGEAVCIIADTDQWCVNVASSRDVDKPFEPLTKPVIASQLVCNLMEGVLQLCKLKMSSEFCLMHLEDRLQEIFFKSKMLAEYLKDVKKCNIKELTQLLGFEPGDLPLLVAIAGTHSPHLSLGVI